MKLLKSAVDKKAELLDIYWMDNLIMCPALSMLLKVYAEMIDRGHSNPFFTWSNKNRVVWAQKGNQIVGGICYEYDAGGRIGWIVLSFTDPEFRGRGINELLHYAMEDDVKRLGGDRICSLVHIDNISRQKSAEKVGLRPQFYRMNKFLNQTGDDAIVNGVAARQK